MKSEANRSRVARKTGSKPRHTLQDSAHETLTVTDDLGLAQTTLAECDAVFVDLTDFLRSVLAGEI